MARKERTLGEFILEAMRLFDLSNRALATEAGVSESAIRNLLKVGTEEGRPPEARTLIQVAKTLHIPPDVLFRMAGYIPPARPEFSPEAEHVAHLFDLLPPDDQDLVRVIVDMLMTRQEEEYEDIHPESSPDAGI